MTRRSQLKANLKKPLYHIEKAQRAHLEPHQKRIVKAVEEHERVVVTSAHNLGKTYTASKLVLWNTSAFKQSKTITTAPTFRQVELLLWSEIKSGFNKSYIDLGGTMLSTRWKIAEDWFAIGVASRKESGSETHGSSFQGVHAPRVFIVFDEAQGIPPDIWKQAEGMMTSSGVRMLASGNPLNPGSAFHQATKDPFWFHVKLSCFDSANLTVNGLTDLNSLKDYLDKISGLSKLEQLKAVNELKVVKPHLLTAKWCIQMCMKHGLDHPLVQGKVLGEFPDKSSNTLIPLDLVELAQQNGIGKTDLDHSQNRYLGVDVARMGSDKTVICDISDNGLFGLKRMQHKDNAEVAGFITQMVNKNEQIHAVAIDATGVGSGVVDILRDNRRGGFIRDITIIEAHFGASATTDETKKHFCDLKAEIFTGIKEDLKNGFWLNQDEIWEDQLADIRFTPDAKGRTRLESKDDYKARTGKSSPDESDALALAILAKNHKAKKVDVTFDLGGLNLEKQSIWRS